MTTTPVLPPSVQAETLKHYTASLHNSLTFLKRKRLMGHAMFGLTTTMPLLNTVLDLKTPKVVLLLNHIPHLQAPKMTTLTLVIL